LIRRYTPRNDCIDAICLCERSVAIPLLNTFAITSYDRSFFIDCYTAAMESTGNVKNLWKTMPWSCGNRLLTGVESTLLIF
jgi:hypothetical protein